MDPINQTSPQMPQPQGEGNSMQWVVIAVVVVVLLIAAGWMFMRKEAHAPMPQEAAPTAAPQVPPATGNVAELISALESAEVAEALVANAGDNDISLVTSDADAVSGMNTPYNDNEF